MENLDPKLLEMLNDILVLITFVVMFLGALLFLQWFLGRGKKWLTYH